MTTVLIVDGAADLVQLARNVPDLDIHVVPHLERPPQPAASRATALVLRSGVWLGGHELRALPALRHVVRPGSGTDGMDMAALAVRGITVHRNPTVSAAAVAEWALLAMLALVRRVPLGHNGLSHGQHLKRACTGQSLSTKRVAIWGAGPVGVATGQALRPWTREVAYAAWPSNPVVLPQVAPTELPRWADAHVVALPLLDATRGLFGEAFLTETGPRRPLLVCVGRADTLDVPACLAALRDGRLSGLAVDAVETDHVPLFTGLDQPLNLLATPHVGAQRTDVRRALDLWVVRTLRAVGSATDGAR
ncbi:MAG: hydroxyacid dehydrogenase [Actinobacteria bacterium]|nr:hydroxyacid dehydrogenase [Actinomycetota bacterium]